MNKAIWGIDYDDRSDKVYRTPLHLECDAPITISKEGKFVCVGCGEECKLTWLMKRHVKKVNSHKTKTEKCFTCGSGKFLAVYHRNPATLKWEFGYGKCPDCGARIIV